MPSASQRRATSPALPREPARVARMLALGHHLRAAIDAERVKDFAAAARELGVSRQRISTVVRLTFLAPDIQEEILMLEAGPRTVTEREVFDRVARMLAWADQRAAWRLLATHMATAPR